MIYVVTGPPCGGKSSYVREHMRPGDVRVDFDLLAQALGSADAHDPNVSDSVFAVTAAARRAVVGRVLDTEQPLTNDSWLIWQKVPPVMAERLEAVDAEFVEVDPGKEECLRRAREDNRPQRTFDGIEQYYAGEESEKGGRQVQTKSVSATVKAASADADTAQGVVSMLVSVFGNVDSYGDMVMPGAFSKTLSEWAAKGDPIPFVWSHQWGDPFAILGEVTKAAETEDGLEVEAKIDLETELGKQVYGLLKKRLVTQASFAYDIDEAEWVEHEAPDGGKYGVYELRKLSLLEVGPCLLGANRETELLEVKARELADRIKAGRPLSDNVLQSLAKAHSYLGGVLDATADTASGDGPGTGDEKSTPTDGAQIRARLNLNLMEGIDA